MKVSYRIFYIILLIALCIGGYFLGVHSAAKVKPTFSDLGSARLLEDGTSVKILTSEMKGGLGRVFIFQYSDGSIANAFTVENFNLGGSEYRIVKGNKHDWLVITTSSENGTGFIKYTDDWYLVNPYFGGMQKVLSYDSKVGFYNPSGETEETLAGAIFSTTTDDVLDVKYTTKKCTEKEICKTTSETKRYVWMVDKEDDAKSQFVLKK